MRSRKKSEGPDSGGAEFQWRPHHRKGLEGSAVLGAADQTQSVSGSGTKFDLHVDRFSNSQAINTLDENASAEHYVVSCFMKQYIRRDPLGLRYWLSTGAASMPSWLGRTMRETPPTCKCLCIYNSSRLRLSKLKWQPKSWLLLWLNPLICVALWQSPRRGQIVWIACHETEPGKEC